MLASSIHRRWPTGDGLPQISLPPNQPVPKSACPQISLSLSTPPVFTFETMLEVKVLNELW